MVHKHKQRSCEVFCCLCRGSINFTINDSNNWCPFVGDLLRVFQLQYQFSGEPQTFHKKDENYYVISSRNKNLPQNIEMSFNCGKDAVRDWKNFMWFGEKSTNTVNSLFRAEARSKIPKCYLPLVKTTFIWIKKRQYIQLFRVASRRTAWRTIIINDCIWFHRKHNTTGQIFKKTDRTRFTSSFVAY